MNIYVFIEVRVCANVCMCEYLFEARPCFRICVLCVHMCAFVCVCVHHIMTNTIYTCISGNLVVSGYSCFWFMFKVISGLGPFDVRFYNFQLGHHVLRTNTRGIHAEREIFVDDNRLTGH